MFNFQQAMSMIQQIQNPQQMLQKMGLPQEAVRDPNAAADYLLQSGKVTQQHIDQVKQMYQMFKR